MVSQFFKIIFAGTLVIGGSTGAGVVSDNLRTQANQIADSY